MHLSEIVIRFLEIVDFFLSWHRRFESTLSVFHYRVILLILIDMLVAQSKSYQSVKINYMTVGVVSGINFLDLLIRSELSELAQNQQSDTIADLRPLSHSQVVESN